MKQFRLLKRLECFLATGDSYDSLMILLLISVPSLSKIVSEMCIALVDALKDCQREHRKLPEPLSTYVISIDNKSWDYTCIVTFHCIM